MHWNWFSAIGVSFLALVIGLATAATSIAQAAAPQAGAKKEKSHLLKELHSAHKLLSEADRNYDGHRAKAAEEVHKAIQELEGKPHPKKATTAVPPAVTGKPKAKTPPMHEAQATSDDQLRKAQTILEGVQPHLKTHHPKAAANVAAAIDELKTALSIK
jgi:hypothetical protein